MTAFILVAVFNVYGFGTNNITSVTEFSSMKVCLAALEEVKKTARENSTKCLEVKK